MPRLRPWFHVVSPREDLREGRPLDASEFAVHLDQVRDGRAPEDYLKPERFFERTYMTKGLADLAAQMVRRLSGIKVETSAVFNMATQFGGGKTHALTLLYHLAEAGPKAHAWRGVKDILSRAGVSSVPEAAAAVFVGTEFDSITGRGGTDGEPLRRTPWGEIAWQLGGAEAFNAVAAHDERGTAPAGDAVRAFLPERPTVILMDELMNYISRNRKSGLAAQFYSFLHSLSEEARARDNLVLAVSIPASELEMNPEDQRDYESLKKLLDRLGKALFMSAETEVAEIIRRRLFEWQGLPEEAVKTAAAYAYWVTEYRQLVGDVDAASARELFKSCYPFHPALISVFERKWQSLPRFQKTRGILRLLALWVSHAYQAGYRGAHRDPLIGLGTAPLEDPYFRAAMFEQLGNNDLEGAVTTDIAGRREAHAVRLDREAPNGIKKARLHQKVATTIFFESNGGQTRAEATVPEIRFAVGEPELDIGNVETVLEALSDTCYYLNADRNRYRFSQSPNLNKMLTDRRATIKQEAIDKRVRQEIQTIFKAGPEGFTRRYFPENSSQVPDQAVLTLVILAPDQPLSAPDTRKFIETVIREHGSLGRTFKSALLFAVPDESTQIQDAARKLLAWEEIADDTETIGRLDAAQQRQLKIGTDRAVRDLKEAVWRAYRYVLLLNKDNTLKEVDLGPVHTSAANSMVELILNRLKAEDEITEDIGPHKLVRYWPPTKEWSTQAVREAFYASPTLPRLLDPRALRRTITDGVAGGVFGYAGKDADGRFVPLYFETTLAEADIEFSNEVYLLPAAEARKYIEPPRLARMEIRPGRVRLKPGERISFAVACFDQHDQSYPCPPVTWSATGGRIDKKGLYVAETTIGSYYVQAKVDEHTAGVEVDVLDDSLPPPPPPLGRKGLRWRGAVPPQKWMNLYTKVLSRYATNPKLKLEVMFELPAENGITEAQKSELRVILRELGLSEDIEEV
ncbi:MAG: DUF499 domain-containing protein [Bacillota bacterium]|uniref:ATP-binding protein n=1 Tax=Desulforudis sp. DRI-14 TaxID=3459793 RepID=UPI00346C8287